MSDDGRQERTGRCIEDWIGAVTMLMLALITFLNVVVRYLTNQSFAWSEEISISLMVVLTLVAASAAVLRDRHIRLRRPAPPPRALLGPGYRRRLPHARVARDAACLG
jgi:amino acid transporter